MCGRYTLAKPLKAIKAHFHPMIVNVEHQERYNIAPTQEVPVVISIERGRELEAMRFGLIPSWAKDKKIGSKLINARAESVHVKPSFRNSFKRQRCLVPADGFYEWRKTNKDKIPQYVYLKSQELFAFAGIWAEWLGEKEPIRSFSIITTDSNSLLKEIHDRMPVILDKENYDLWLEPSTPLDKLFSLLSPFPSELMEFYRVSEMVNSYKVDQPECVMPIKA
jgi:putative SOS response-associated peptidase YedK